MMITRIIQIEYQMCHISGKRHHNTDQCRKKHGNKPLSSPIGVSLYPSVNIRKEYCRDDKLHNKEICIRTPMKPSREELIVIQHVCCTYIHYIVHETDYGIESEGLI